MTDPFLTNRHYRVWGSKGIFEIQVSGWDEAMVKGLVADPLQSSIQLDTGTPVRLPRNTHSFMLISEPRPVITIQRKGD